MHCKFAPGREWEERTRVEFKLKFYHCHDSLFFLFFWTYLVSSSSSVRRMASHTCSSMWWRQQWARTQDTGSPHGILTPHLSVVDFMFIWGLIVIILGGKCMMHPAQQGTVTHASTFSPVRWILAALSSVWVRSISARRAFASDTLSSTLWA